MWLFNYNKKQHKDKTSEFIPIQELIHHGNIAPVTKRRTFNKAMITPFTEVIFIDEASESTLDDDVGWKVVTQGDTLHMMESIRPQKPFSSSDP